MSEHDNDTCPHLVRASLLEAEVASLKADAQLVVKHLGEACADNLRLKADVVELADALKLASEVGIKVADEVTRLKAEVERLRNLFADTERLMLLDGEYEAAKVGTYARLKAGDEMAEEIIGCYEGEGYDPADSETLPKWNAAKEGKQP